ncbi:peritrophin-48-like [Malaya genurostris]|uniref:peritrophin-48-like n=1 Tax=Malaya genurostris TaxID=325434 RepID=UPI0026F3FA35|nr:peritrophin-48-like [Malaya genurostris]
MKATRIAFAVVLVVLVSLCNGENRDVNDICLGVPDSTYVGSLISCSYYYACIDGVAHGFSCDEGKWFSLEQQACVLPAESDCDIEQPPELPEPPPPNPSPICDGVPNFQYIPSTENCQIYYQCIDNIAYRLSCPKSYWFNVTAQRCGNRYEFGCDLLPGTTTTSQTTLTTSTTVPTSAPNRCAGAPNFSFISDPTFCGRFSICMSGIDYPMTCWDDLWFDYEQQTCIEPSQSDCNESTPPTSPPAPNVCENIPDGVSVLHSSYCNEYLTCMDQVGTSTVCTDGLWFDTDQQECSHPIDAYCPYGVNELPPTPNICIGIEDGVLVASPYNCHSYYVCANDIAYRVFCPPDQYFDRERQICYHNEHVICPV